MPGFRYDRHDRYRSPPPSPPTPANWLVCLLKELAWLVLVVLEGIVKDMSAFHRILASQLLILTVAVELLRPDRADMLLSMSLGVIKLALGIDCIIMVTNRLTHLSTQNKALAFVKDQTPLVSGPFLEWALALGMIRGNAMTATNTFLIGCSYAKPLMAGALCLAATDLHTRQSALQSQTYGLPDDASHISRRSAMLVLAMATTFGLSLTSLPIFTAAGEDSQWLARGAPLLLILHIGFSYYYLCWKATTRSQTADRNHGTNPKDYEPYRDSESLFLLVCLGALKVGAVFLVRSVLDHVHAVAWTTSQDSTWVTSEAIINFAILPLVVTAVDHSADVSTAYYQGDINTSWTRLCRSLLQTWFFFRPLVSMAGHDVDPWSGRLGISLCFLGISVWLSPPALSGSLKCSVLLLAYFAVLVAFTAYPEYFETYML